MPAEIIYINPHHYWSEESILILHALVKILLVKGLHKKDIFDWIVSVNGHFKTKLAFSSGVGLDWYCHTNVYTDIQQTDTDTPFQNLYQTDTDTDI